MVTKSTIVVQVEDRTLYVYQGDQIVGTFPIAVGKPSTPTPRGTYTIIEKVEDPGGPFGTRWLGLSKLYYGIHGTDEPHLIDQAVSNGCIRMHNEDVEVLYDLVFVDTVVQIPEAVHEDPADEEEEAKFYIVKSGDSLWAIAHQFRTTVEALVKLNKLPDPDIIYPGQKLRLPEQNEDSLMGS